MAFYNEYKFLVPNEKLEYVKAMLESFHGHSDLFPEGVVDSIYYDSMDRAMYRQCLDGEPRKTKFRIRGYGREVFSTIHLKMKDVYGVSKLKCGLHWQSRQYDLPIEWSEIPAYVKSGGGSDEIFAASDQFGRLVPAIRIRYYRYRYRINDYRMTLDTRIEAQGYSNGWDRQLNYAVLPYHVLELKTEESRPVLPFMNLIQLPQTSFSKFFLGSQLLETGTL